MKPAYKTTRVSKPPVVFPNVGYVWEDYNLLMGEGLQVQRIVPPSHSEVISQTLANQCLFKVLRSGVFDHGLKSSRMTRYRYASGDLILARRDTEEWLRWVSGSEMLMVEIPDEALRDVAETSGSSDIEVEGTPYLDDGRIAALLQSLEAEEAGHFPAGRLFLDGIGRALAAALLGSRGVLRRPLRGYVGALPAVRLRRVIESIHAHLDRDMTVTDLARTAGLSPAHFSE